MWYMVWFNHEKNLLNTNSFWIFKDQFFVPVQFSFGLLQTQKLESVAPNGNLYPEPKTISTENGSVETEDKDVVSEGLGSVGIYDQWVAPSVSGQRPKARYEVTFLSMPSNSQHGILLHLECLICFILLCWIFSCFAAWSGIDSRKNVYFRGKPQWSLPEWSSGMTTQSLKSFYRTCTLGYSFWFIWWFLVAQYL